MAVAFSLLVAFALLAGPQCSTWNTFLARQVFVSCRRLNMELEDFLREATKPDEVEETRRRCIPEPEN